jgi:hypothetical protein
VAGRGALLSLLIDDLYPLTDGSAPLIPLQERA